MIADPDSDESFRPCVRPSEIRRVRGEFDRDKAV
jgi:hypothetical protein